MTVLVRPQALDNFKVREFQMLIDGRWTDGAEGGRHRAQEPRPWRCRFTLPGRNQSRCRARHCCRTPRVRQWAVAAHDGAERSNILLKAADLIAARSDELAHLDCIESGKPISQAKAKSVAPSISGAMRLHLPATCMAKAITRSAMQHWASCCARRSASSRSSRPGISRSLSSARSCPSRSPPAARPW